MLFFQGFELNAVTGKGLSALSFPYLWTEKAQVLIQLGLYQPARLLLSEAHAAAQVPQKQNRKREISRMCMKNVHFDAVVPQNNDQITKPNLTPAHPKSVSFEFQHEVYI